jgi:hypothetical protein
MDGNEDPRGVFVIVDAANDFADPTNASSLDRPNRGVVAVHVGRLHARAVCSCGWTGRLHLVSAVAVYEAHLHSAQNRCYPAVPLWVHDNESVTDSVFH